MLRKIRVTLAIICFILITLLFLDFTGTISNWFGWLAKIQFLPAILALNIGVVIGLIVLTLLFGRVYCSVICPLGVFQDIVSWFRRKFKKHKFKFSSAIKWLRYGVLIIFSLLIIFGFSNIALLIAPYSAYGRIAGTLFAPVYQYANNILAYFSEHYNNYAFYTVDIWIKSISVLVISSITLLLIIVLSWRNGRIWCNTICPVGTVLGFLSKYAIFRPIINTQKCKNCSLCARNCKSSCINIKEHAIDYSRCVACMDCIGNCNQNAIHFTSRFKNKIQTNNNSAESNEATTVRRNFLTTLGLFTVSSALFAQGERFDGGLAAIENKKVPKRAVPLKPAGSSSIKNFSQRCTACQLCVSECPNLVLRPSEKFLSFMQPEMSYERGYCRPECTKCATICPTGAIQKISSVEKSSIQIGHAIWIKNNCVVMTDKVQCTNCYRHCPAGAISMVTLDGNTLETPVIDTERCIGCGACENLCPARPFSAIYIEGHEVHREV